LKTEEELAAWRAWWAQHPEWHLGYRAPNANAYAERFVRSIKHECLNHVILLGERPLRQTIAAYAEHYHRERNHQGLGNELIDPSAHQLTGTRIRRRPRLGGLLNYYERAA